MTNSELIEVIDGFLKELGTTGLVDARKARDQLMDLRLMIMANLDASIVPLILAVDPDLVEGIASVRPSE